MADFGVQATSLSAPQGAGANVVNPVQVAPTEMRDTDTGLLNVAASVVDVFSKGLIQSRKEEAEKVKNTIVQGYIREETILNDAVASGQMTASQAAARSRANFNKYAAGHGQYIDEFEKAGRALRGFTEKGEVEKTLETEAKRKEADIAQAQQRGFTFIPGMSPQATDAQIFASKKAIQAETELANMYKTNAEARAQGTFDQAVAARQEKDLGFRLVNDIAGSNLTAFQEFGKTLGDQVRAGKMAPEMAVATLNERFSNISAAMQAAARTNPELAAPYRSLFEDVYKINQKLIDPKENAENLANELKVKETQMKLVAMGDPKVAAAVVANQLLPNNASLALSSAPQGVRAIAILSSIPVGDKTYTPRVVGNPDAEESTLKLLKGGLNDLKTGKVAIKDIAKAQASNSVNHILKQTGEMINLGAGPTELKGVANFFASPEYAGFVSSNALDPEAAGAAKKTFQLLYEPAIINGVQTRLNQALFDPKQMARATGGGSGSDLGGKAPTPAGEAINVKFSGSGVVFELKPSPNLTPVELKMQQEAFQTLRAAQQGVNQLIHIGAHMEGSTDYGKYWEENKHIYMPSIFPDPNQLKPGAVVDGYKYIGGAYNDRANWKPVSTGK